MKHNKQILITSMKVLNSVMIRNNVYSGKQNFQGIVYLKHVSSIFYAFR